MNISYTGKQEYLHPKQKALLDGKVAKIAKLLEVDGKGDKNTRVALTQLKNEHRAEVTLNYLDHTVVGEHADADQFTALNQAFEKLERQMMRIREKRRDVKKVVPKEASWEDSTGDVAEAEMRPTNRNATGKSASPGPATGKPTASGKAPANGKQAASGKTGTNGVPAANGKPKIYRVTPEDGKPLTEHEAVLMIGDEPYMVYNTAGSGRLAVLIRRPDANFDLVEC